MVEKAIVERWRGEVDGGEGDNGGWMVEKEDVNEYMNSYIMRTLLISVLLLGLHSVCETPALFWAY